MARYSDDKEGKFMQRRVLLQTCSPPADRSGRSRGRGGDASSRRRRGLQADLESRANVYRDDPEPRHDRRRSEGQRNFRRSPQAPQAMNNMMEMARRMGNGDVMLGMTKMMEMMSR